MLLRRKNNVQNQICKLLHFKKVRKIIVRVGVEGTLEVSCDLRKFISFPEKIPTEFGNPAPESNSLALKKIVLIFFQCC